MGHSVVNSIGFFPPSPATEPVRPRTQAHQWPASLSFPLGTVGFVDGALTDRVTLGFPVDRGGQDRYDLQILIESVCRKLCISEPRRQVLL